MALIKTYIFSDHICKKLIKQARNSNLTENSVFGDSWAASNPFP